MLNLRKPFPFFLNDDRENFLLIIGVTIFTYLFLVAFKPFGPDAATPAEQIRYTGLCFLVMCFNLLLLPRLAVRWLDSGNMTLGKYLYFNIYNLLTVSIAISISNIIEGSYLAFGIPIWELILVDLSHVVMLGIIPMVVVTFISRDKLLLNTINSGSVATERLRAFKNAPSPVNGNMVAIHSDTKETMELAPSSFLYAQAENNYTELYWQEQDEVKSRLMRLSLKHLEDQLANSHTIRCHRSYLVNLKKVASVSGNANGYRLHMAHADVDIPVSRSLGKDVLVRIQELASA